MQGEFLKRNQVASLERLAEGSAPEAIRRRATILLWYHAGKSTAEIARQVDISPRSVRYWRAEFLKRGMEVFPDAFVGSNLKQVDAVPAIERLPAGSTTPKPRAASVSAFPAASRFPRPRKKPGIKPDDTMTQAGYKTLLFHFAQMLHHEKGTRLGADIEELHDMRVATRRMRAAFEVFGPFLKRKEAKQQLKGLRATGRALGRVRDLDVFMEKAQRYVAVLPETERPGLEPLVQAWQEKLTLERKKMVAYLEGDRYMQFKRGLNVFISSQAGIPVSFTSNKPEPVLVRHVAPPLIHARLAAVRAFDVVIPKASIEQLHALRIEFKKLRYALEFFREVLGAEGDEVIDEIKKLQDHLGDLNDADVACRILREFIESWQERQAESPLQVRKNPEPVVAYLASKHAELHQLMVSFPDAWTHFHRHELLRKLALAISIL